MQTLIAYAFDRPRPDDRVSTGLRRVEAHYSRLWNDLAERRGCDAGQVGIHVWDRAVADCLWPSWQHGQGLRVATLYAPLGYERLVGDLPPARAAAPLAHGLFRSPAGVFEMAPPFVLAALDVGAQRLELFTDAVGLGRLFQLRVVDGWVWSNRPAAACLFAGIPAAPAARGWLYAAGSDWFMDDTTPYDRVLIVPGATRITSDGRRGRRTVSRIEPASAWSDGRGGASLATRADETAAALLSVARSFNRLWPSRPTVDLSGGRDSRVVAAAFLAAGVDLKINTHDAVPGELAVAEQLVAALPFPVEHVISRRVPTADGARPPAPAIVERVLRWHRYGEGLRPASYLSNQAPRSLSAVSHLAIGGAGGEIAHGHFYPGDVLKLDAMPLERRVQAFVTRLGTRLVPAVGPTPRARDAVTNQIDRVLREAIWAGIEDATMLDYFYVTERLRRWGTAGERNGVVSPLLVSAFIQAAFALIPQQRLDNALHRALLHRLVPQWADVPFFKQPAVPASPGTRPDPPPSLMRVADAADRDVVEALVSDPGRWADSFDVEAVRQLWAASAARESTAVGEAVLRRVLWRAVFEDHLAEVNAQLTPARPPGVQLSLPVRQSPPPARVSPFRRRIRRNRAVRRLARTSAWRTLRATKLGHLVRIGPTRR